MLIFWIVLLNESTFCHTYLKDKYEHVNSYILKTAQDKISLLGIDNTKPKQDSNKQYIKLTQ